MKLSSSYKNKIGLNIVSRDSNTSVKYTKLLGLILTVNLLV